MKEKVSFKGKESNERHIKPSNVYEKKLLYYF